MVCYMRKLKSKFAKMADKMAALTHFREVFVVKPL